jgi:hypothetical protein
MTVSWGVVFSCNTKEDSVFLQKKIEETVLKVIKDFQNNG